MKNLIAAVLLITAAIIAGCTNAGGTAKQEAPKQTVQYVCTPCGQHCDTTVYDQPGTCSHCNMKRVDKATVKFGSIQPEDICTFITAKGKTNVLLLDVRTPDEFNGKAPEKFGRLANAINIPVQQLQQRISELDQFRDKEIIVYCSHSHRSPAASYLLNQNGFNKVTNMQYGMSEWTARTKPGHCAGALYIQQ
jgi:rhodanese-related sulfurtransferase/DNA-directed RNA polymerase subunit RPC12/RpoP